MKKVTFDLEKALSGQPVITRSGFRVKAVRMIELFHYYGDFDCPVEALIKTYDQDPGEGLWMPGFDTKGISHGNHDLDLFMVG